MRNKKIMIMFLIIMTIFLTACEIEYDGVTVKCNSDMTECDFTVNSDSSASESFTSGAWVLHKAKDLKTKDAKEVRDRGLTQNQTAELILRKSGQTAKLSEIKKQSIYNTTEPLVQKAAKQTSEFETSVNGKNAEEKQKTQKPQSEQVKKLLKDSLKGKSSARR